MQNNGLQAASRARRYFQMQIVGFVLHSLLALLFLGQAVLIGKALQFEPPPPNIEVRADGSQLNPLDIVLIADASGEAREIGNDIARGFDDAIREAGLDRELRLVTRDDGGRANAVAALAEGAALGFHTLAMVGPTQSNGYAEMVAAAAEGTLLALAPIGAPSGIEPNSFAYSMQPPNTKTGEMLGRILQRVLPGDRLVLLALPGSRPDGYWDGVVLSYAGRAGAELTLEPWPTDQTPEQQRERLARHAQADAVLVNLPMKEAEAAIRQLRVSGHGGRIVVLGEASLASFAERFTDDRRERITPGFFTNGIIAAVPFTPRMSSAESQRRVQAYIARNNAEPSWAYASGYDAGLLLAEFIRHSKADGSFTLTDPDRMRSLLHDWMRARDADSGATSGFTGRITFDSTHQRDTPLKLVEFVGRRQLPLIVQLSDRPRLVEQVGPGEEAIRLGELAYPLIPAVQVGFRLHALEAVNFDSGTFTGSFDFWLKSTDDIGIEQIAFLNQVGPLKSVRLVTESTGGSSRYRLWRVEGEFRFVPKPSDMLLRRSRIAIEWRHRTLDIAQLRLVLDAEAQRSEAAPGSVENSRQDYRVVSEVLAVDDRLVDGLGDPRSRDGRLNYYLGSYSAEIARVDQTLTARIMAMLGGTGVALAFIVLAIGFALLCLLRLAWRSDALKWAIYPTLLLTGVFSEFALFTGALADRMAPATVSMILLAYEFAYVLIVVTMVDMLLEKLLLRRQEGQGLHPVVRLIFRTMLYLAGIAFFYTTVLDRDIWPVLATTSVLLTVIGFALRELIFDAIAGIAIAADNSMRIGQWVTVRTRDRVISGRLDDWGWRFACIRSRDDEVHFVPNGLIATQILSNMSLHNGYTRLQVPFTMSATVDTAALVPRIHESVAKAMGGNDTVDHSRPIRVVLSGLEGHRVHGLVMLYYLAEFGTDSARSAVLEAVRKALHDAGALDRTAMRPLDSFSDADQLL